MTDHRKFDLIVTKIEEFRQKKATRRERYRKFFAECCREEIETIYADVIEAGQIRTRESTTESLARFVRTKRSNLRDYADACFRYLRATGVVEISQAGHSLSIARNKAEDVDFILEHVDREPYFPDDETKYKEYLFDSREPRLLTDDVASLKAKINALDPSVDTSGSSLVQLKDKELVLRVSRREHLLDEQVTAIKEYRSYDDIQCTFDAILRHDYYDGPLMFEWNVWRAMTMLDGGLIEPNFKIDDSGQPMSTAAGNMADIVCDYGDFGLAVEVTLQSGQRQYQSEAEPVARHLGRLKELMGRRVYCLFIAPTINQAAISHFYALHKINIALYGGKAVIVPMELGIFRKMMEASYVAGYVPEPRHIESLFLESVRISECSEDENEWYSAMQRFALNWPNAG